MAWTYLMERSAMHDDYKPLDTPEGVMLDPCPLCASDASLWQYSESETAPRKLLVCCTHGDRIGPQDGLTNEGCPFYMPPDHHYRETIRDAVRYWNELARAIVALREANTAGVRVPALPFDAEYVRAYLEEVLTAATGNADPEVQKLLAWLADGVKPSQASSIPVVCEHCDEIGNCTAVPMCAARGSAGTLPTFDDPRVQAVYAVLCDEQEPPKGEHWEGFTARRIVAALGVPEVGAPRRPYACPHCDQREGYAHGEWCRGAGTMVKRPAGAQRAADKANATPGVPPYAVAGADVQADRVVLQWGSALGKTEALAGEASRALGVMAVGKCPGCVTGNLWPFDHKGLPMARCDNCGMEVNDPTRTSGVTPTQASRGHGNLVICVPHGVWDCPKCRERKAGVAPTEGGNSK